MKREKEKNKEKQRKKMKKDNREHKWQVLRLAWFSVYYEEMFNFHIRTYR